MKQFKLYLLAILASAIMFSCGSDDESPFTDLTDVIVINEGNFSNADGSLSGYDIDTEVVDHQLFDNANGFGITATIQNVVLYDNKYFVVGNSPDKVEIANAADFTSLGSVSAENGNLANPFMFAAIGNKGYISNWGTLNTTDYSYEDPFLTVIDLTDFSVIKKIELDTKPQDLMVYGDKLYITNADGSAISILDVNTDELTGSISTPFGPDRLVKDRNDKLWVICRAGALVRFDPSSNELETTIDGVATSGFNEKLVINSAGDKLYYLAAQYGEPSAVYEMAIDADTAPTGSLVSGDTFYGIGVDDNTLYVGDNNGFQGTGTVYLYNLDGTKKSEFEAGIAPNGFIFND